MVVSPVYGGKWFNVQNMLMETKLYCRARFDFPSYGAVCRLEAPVVKGGKTKVKFPQSVETFQGALVRSPLTEPRNSIQPVQKAKFANTF